MAKDERLHIASIRFEDGRVATVTIRDAAVPILHVEGLRYVTKTSLESYTIAPAIPRPVYVAADEL